MDIQYRLKTDNMVFSFIKSNVGVLLALLAMGTVLSIVTNTFLTVDNILVVLRQVSINAILAFAMTLVLIVGGIDLAVGSVVAATGVFTVMLITNFGLPVPVCIALALLMGIGFGFINGFIVSRTTIPPFIVTLATQTSIRGLSYMLADGKSISSTSDTFNSIGNSYVGPIPIPIIIMIVIMAFCSILLNRTRFGRRMYAVGGNRDAAKYTGINVKGVTQTVYIISGLLSGIAGVVLASRLYSGQPTAGNAYEADAIAAAVLGGTSFTGGIGAVGGTIIGAIVIGILNNGLNLMQVTFYWQFVIKGIVIIIAVYLDTVKNARQVRFKKTEDEELNE